MTFTVENTRLLTAPLLQRLMGFSLFRVSLLLVLAFGSIEAVGQCRGYNFRVNDSNICQNQVPTFRTLNVSGQGEFTWFLGLDTISGEGEDTVSTGYTVPGSYTVKLKIKLKNGDTCTIIKPNYIKVGKAPAAPNITVDKSSICDVTEQVRIQTTSTGMNSWTWNVGQILYKDSSESVTHKFLGPGFYDVSLTIQDAFGCSSTTRVDSLVLVERKPEVDLLLPDTAYCDTQTIFLFPKINMYGQKGFAYNWTLDGSDIKFSTKQRPGKLFYGNSGTYGFSLETQSSAKCTYRYNFPNDSVRIGEEVNFNIKKNSSAPCNSQDFEIEVTNGSDLKVPLDWDFKGDSIEVEIKGTTAEVSYKKAGRNAYIITHDHNGCISEFRSENISTISRTKARFEFSKYCSCTTPDTFQAFNASAGISNAASYRWEIFDSKNNVVFSSTLFEPEVVLKEFEVYDVFLFVQDTTGCTDSTKDFGTLRIEEPDLTISASPKTACIGGDISFGMDSICKSGFQSAEWKFFDKDMNLVATSNDELPIMSFNDEGSYSVELIYQTNKCADTVLKMDAFEVVGLQEIDFVLSDTIPCEGQVMNASLKIKPEDITPKVRWTLQHETKTNAKYTAVPVFDQENEFILKPEVTGAYKMKIVVDGGKGCIDSLEVDDLVKVSGVKADFAADQTVGCIPFKANLSASVSRNEHYGSPGQNELIYNWRVLPEDGKAVLKDPEKSRTEININSSGSYNVFLTVQNTDGCASSVLKEDLFKFDFNALFSLDSVTCQNIEIQPTNNTPGSNISYRWFAATPHLQFETKNTARQPVLRFTEPGTYELFLEAETKDGCLDTASQTIVVYPYGLSYDIENSEPKCTPAQYIFNINSTNVDTFTWVFGDGKSISTDQRAIAHVYDLSTVKPFRNTFKALLIGSNDRGCVDTFFNGERLEVLGPNPTFVIDNNVGCDPMRVTFTDSTEQVTKFYFNYGDGSSVDSISFDEYVYSKKDTSKRFEVFKPYIIASDKNGCRVLYEPLDSIVVYERSKPRFSTANTRGCSPYTLPFTNNSSFATQSIWDYRDSDLKKDKDTTENGSHTYPAGVYSVKLVTSNEIGCKDSLTRLRYITVTNPPTALFNASDTITCIGIPVDFQDQTNAEHNLLKWNWEFILDEDTITSTATNPSMLLSDTGRYHVKLLVRDIHGCTDSVIRRSSLHIVERLPVKTPELLLASVEENNLVELRWTKPRRLGFRELQIFQDEDFTAPVFRTISSNDHNAILTEPEVTDRPVQYTLKLVDKCDDPERVDDTHSTIHLSVTRDERPFANLAWTHYEGWDLVNEYVIYRRKEGEGLVEIKRVPYPENTYTDFSVCNEKYTYVILSVDPETRSVVYSNSVDYDPQYSKPEDELDLQLVTVDRNNIYLRWTSNSVGNAHNYYIDRYDPYTGWRSELRETEDTFFIDSIVNVNRIYYHYRVWYRDFCGRKSPVSNEGSSILLSQEVSSDAYLFNWTPYTIWSNGIKNYTVEITYDLKRPFTTDTVLGPGELAFTKRKTSITKDSSFFMRIKAVENGENPDTSVSNIVKVDPEALVYVPNAFSPNRDNVNDLFNYEGVGISLIQDDDYMFEVYNRWGQCVFRSESLGEFWDGTFRGQSCVEGVYAYYLRLRGIDNTVYNYHGTVTLLK